VTDPLSPCLLYVRAKSRQGDPDRFPLPTYSDFLPVGSGTVKWANPFFFPTITPRQKGTFLLSY
jgi:hypothetical protein